MTSRKKNLDGDVGTCSGLRCSSRRRIGIIKHRHNQKELEQSLEEEGRTGAASDIVKVIDEEKNKHKYPKTITFADHLYQVPENVMV